MAREPIPVRESLIAMAREARRASDGSVDSALAALRDCSASIEHHLDTLARETAPGSDRLTPGVFPLARKVQDDLRALLVRCWETEQGLRERAIGSSALVPIAYGLLEAASYDLAMVFEALRETGTVD